MNNISTLNRVFRIALSLGLVVVVLNSTGPLGLLTYLPFISIYAGITAFIGWDPVTALLTKLGAGLADKHSPDYHGELVTH